MALLIVFPFKGRFFDILCLESNTPPLATKASYLTEQLNRMISYVNSWILYQAERGTKRSKLAIANRLYQIAIGFRESLAAQVQPPAAFSNSP
ncbi:MAG: hypothetical protein ACI90R_000669 [Alteromonas macleodii]